SVVCEMCDLQSVFFFQAEDGIRDWSVTGVQTCALPISSRSTAAWARSLSFQTCAAVNTTNKPKIMANGDSIPVEIALNARARSPFASAVTSPWIAAAIKYVKAKTTRVIHKIGRLCSQSLMLGSPVPIRNDVFHSK